METILWSMLAKLFEILKGQDKGAYKEMIAEVLDTIQNKCIESENKIDDKTVIPFITLIRYVGDLPEYD